MRNRLEKKKLGVLFDFINGRGFKKTEWENSGVPIIRIQNLNNINADFNYFKGLYDKKIEVNKGDLLFSWSGTVGTSFGSHIWDREKGVLNQHIFKVEFKKEIKSRFAFYGLRYITEEVEKKVNGAVGLVHITKEKLNQFEIIYPSLSEQQRIVAILDDAFAAIDKAKANAEQNLNNTKELFESYLQSLFENEFEGWEKQRFEDCFKLKSGDSLTSKNMNEDGGYPVFGGNGIAGSHNSFNLSGSNVIIGRVGALCGNVRHITEKIWLTDNAFKVVDFRYNFDHSFLTYLLNFKNLRSFARQTAQPVISNSSLKDVLLQFPKSIKAQQTIVGKLDVLSAKTKKLETIYQQKINDLEELKKSILQKAFAGELTYAIEKATA